MAKSEIGVIADITAALADAGVNILTINTENTGETGLVIMTTEDNDAALRALTMAGFQSSHRRRAGNPPKRRTGRAGQNR